MPDITASITYNELEAYFRAEREPPLIDTAFTACPGVGFLLKSSMGLGREEFNKTGNLLQFRAKGMAQNERLTTGLHYETNVRLNRLSGLVKATAGSVTAIDNSYVDETSPARWGYGEYDQPIGIPTALYKAAKAGGKMAELNLITQKAKSAYQDSIEELAGDLFGTNTAEGSGVLSISAGVGNSASDTTTYGGISRSTYSAWIGNYNARTLSAIATLTDSDYILQAMADDLQTAIDNGADPSKLVFILDSTTYSNVWKSMMGLNAAATNSILGRFNLKNGAGLPNAHSAGLTFNEVPIIKDTNIPAGKMYLIDTDTSYFVGLKGAIFEMEDWGLSENSTSFFNRVTFIGQFVVTAPNRNVISVYS